MFAARFRYTDELVKAIARIEAAKDVIELLPLPPDAGLILRQEARQRSTRASTAIEGNRLNEAEARLALVRSDRDATEAEQEIRNYWRALDRVEDFAAGRAAITEDFIRELHRIVMVRGAGRRGRRSDYRRDECPVVDQATRVIDYGPPGPRDVPPLMEDLADWASGERSRSLPPVVRAGLLAHRFLSIHPFNDGNGRTGRLLATAELWRSGYGMRGFLSFDEHFAADRARYYDALQMGLPVNYYDGRDDPDHTPWLEYFVSTVAQASEALLERAAQLHRVIAQQAPPWERLNRRQQQVLTRLAVGPAPAPEHPEEIRPGDIEEWFGVSATTAREWLRDWCGQGFVDPVPTERGERTRRYRLRGEWARAVRLEAPEAAE